MSQINNGRLGLNGAEHSKCNHVVTLGFEGLMTVYLGRHYALCTGIHFLAI